MPGQFGCGRLSGAAGRSFPPQSGLERSGDSFFRREFDIIEFLLSNRNQIFDKERIYEAIWGYDAEGDSSVIKEHIRKIRAKLTAATGSEYIETVWGMGYKWKE